MRRRLYFGHPINVYGTELQRFLLARITEAFPDWEIENPDQPHHQAGYDRYSAETGRGMRYYFEAVLPSCQGGVFLPFRDGMWGAGVFGEAEVIVGAGHPIWEISYAGVIVPTGLDPFRMLSVEETRPRIRNADGSRKPY